MKPDMHTRFLRKVTFSGLSCWEWTAHKNHLGYGQFGIGKKLYGSHRVSWEIFNSPIPEGMNVLHKCDNPGCVNPMHLFIGTQNDNMQDKMKKGRQGKIRYRRGEDHHSAKLTKEIVLEARKKRSNGSTILSLAIEYGVNEVSMRYALIGKSWRHI